MEKQEVGQSIGDVLRKLGPKPDPVPCEVCGNLLEYCLLFDRWRFAACSVCDENAARKEQEEAREQERKEREERRRRIETREGQLALKIPPKYHGAEFSDIPEAQEEMERFCSHPSAGLVTLVGPCGTGKTRLLYAATRRLYVTGKDYQKWRVPFLVKELQQLCGQNPGSELKKTKELSNFNGHLLLDDLGVERTTDFTVQSLYEIIAEREEWDRPTLITTNLLLDILAKRFDDRIASRLAGGKVLVLKGDDYRLKRILQVPSITPRRECQDAPQLIESAA